MESGLPLQASLLASLFVMATAAHAQQTEKKETAKENSAPIAETTLKEITVKAASMPKPNERLLLDVPTTTGSRLGLTPRQTPASVTIIDRATFESRGAQTTQEALERAPGIIVSDQPGSAGTVCMRGFCGAQITQLFNGITVQYDVVAARPTDNWITNSVEVVGGPSTFLYGQGAVGGSINYISKIANREQQGHEALVLLGSWFNRRAAYGYNGQIGNTRNWVQMHAGYKGSEGYIENTQHNSGVFSASVLSDLTDRLSHTIALEYQIEKRHSYWGTPLLNPLTNGVYDSKTRFKNYNAQDPVFDQEVIWLRDIIDFKLSDATQIKNTFYWYSAERNYRNVEVYKWNASNTLINRTASFAVDHKQNLIGDRVDITHQNKLFTLPAQWSMGADFAFNDQTRYPSSESALAVDTIDPYNFNVGTYWDNPKATGPIKNRNNKLFTAAVYGENRLSLLPNLNLVTGIRVDHLELDSVSYRPVTAAEPGSFSRNWTPVTWRAGLIYDLTEDVNVYVQYSTAASPPAGILTTATFSNLQNYNLSTGKQIEGGTKFNFWDKRGTATLAGYYIERTNLTTRDPNNVARQIPVGAQPTVGMEANLGMRLSPQWSLQGNFAYVDAQFDKFNESVGGVLVSRKGNRPQNIAKWTANAWVTWDFYPGLQWMFSSRFVGSRFADAANTVPIESHARLDTQYRGRHTVTQ